MVVYTERKRNMKRLTLMAAMLCAGLSAGDLVWTGSASATWDKSTANWTNANGVAVAFADGDNVTIDTSLAAVARPTITVATAITPGSVRLRSAATTASAAIPVFSQNVVAAR